jgi:tRNA/rRNA methyltransferase
MAGTFAQPFMSINPQPVIILVEPQMGKNIGMCARAMLNCGLERLRLVRPRDGWPNPAAVATAADADRVLEKVEVFETLEDAVADCHHVVATSARDRSLAVPVVASGEASARVAAWSAGGSRVAVIFGPEASGLDNTVIARAGMLMRFETNPDFSSLNLAQCVLLFGWEWKRAAASLDNDGTEPSATPAPASRGDLDRFLDRLEGALDERGFFLTPDLKPTTVKILRSLFSRTAASEKEVKLLQGVLTALLREKSSDQSDSSSTKGLRGCRESRTGLQARSRNARPTMNGPGDPFYMRRSHRRSAQDPTEAHNRGASFPTVSEALTPASFPDVASEVGMTGFSPSFDGRIFLSLKRVECVI